VYIRQVYRNVVSIDVETELLSVVMYCTCIQSRRWLEVCCGTDNISRKFLIAVPLMLLQQVDRHTPYTIVVPHVQNAFHFGQKVHAL